MPAALKAGTIDAAVLPEPFASVAEQADGAVPLVDLDQGATTNFPVEGYVVTKQWAAKNPRTLAAFDKPLEEGQQIADANRAAVQQAFESVIAEPSKPSGGAQPVEHDGEHALAGVGRALGGQCPPPSATAWAPSCGARWPRAC
jgi:ABC-type nitrate/sulfonate/bicarbonate transport system substrate-binding protein